MLKQDSAYLLRNDGAVFECRFIHPVIRHKSGHYAGRVNSQDIRFFLRCSNNEEFKQLAEEYLNHTSPDRARRDEIVSRMEAIADEEFCRVRISDVKALHTARPNNGEIYFRLSSTETNWFNAIWNLVQENATWIKDITVVKDTTVKTGHEEYYTVDGKQLLHLPLDEFLTLSGEPVIK